MRRLPQHPRHARQERLQLADVLPQRARPLRQLPSHGAEGRRALQGGPAADRRELPREHPRQGTAAGRPDRHRQLRGLPQRPPRAAGRRPALQRQPRQRRPHLREVPPRHLRAVHRERPLAGGHPHRQEAAGVQRLPFRAQHPAHRPLQLPAPHHGPVRPLPRADHRDLLRHLPRQGLQAGLPEDGQVLRLPRRARHPAGDRPALAPEPGQHRRDLRQVPQRLAPAVRRLPDPRHAPRSRSAIRSCSTRSGA